MKKGFTLVELLTVIALMGLLGTAAIGGYRAMQRGMEQKGVMNNANSAIRAVFQRAQIDRQPTLIYFWNETLASETADENAVVVGKAVAIRRHGRLSDVRGKLLVDEFGDLERAYPVSTDEDDHSSGSGNDNDTMYLYPMDNLSAMSSLRRSRVKSRVVDGSEAPLFLTGRKTIGDNKIYAYAFEVVDANGVQWRAGTAYGLEFLSIQLPHGYIFGTQYSNSTEDPIRYIDTLVFKPGVTSSSGNTSDGIVGKSQIDVNYLKSIGATLTPVSIGKTDTPDRNQ